MCHRTAIACRLGFADVLTSGSTQKGGMGDKFEIWSSESWAKVDRELTESFEETLAAVGRLQEEK